MGKKFKIINSTIFITSIIFLMYYISRHNYLFFHILAEFYSILIAFALFVIAWNTKKYSEDYSLTYLGIAYLFIGFIDLTHTIAYKGMKVFQGYEYHANQLWIGARFIEAFTLFFFAAFFRKNYKIKSRYLFSVFFIITAIFLGSVFWIKVFPICFIEGQGQTPFKIYSEYFIIAVLSAAAFLLYRNKHTFPKNIYYLLLSSIFVTILSEMSFTLYSDNYGITNVAGHLLKILSFYLIYKSIIETGLKSPFSLIFSELKESQISLEEANKTKDKFFSIIAHDLRNPVGAISELSKYLRENFNNLNKEELYQDICLLEESADLSKQLLENLLMWARSQTNKIEFYPEAFELKPAIENEIRLLQFQASEKNINISTGQINETEVFADRNMFSIVLRNLINNALKFSYENSTIEIEIENRTDSIFISIIDHGTGIKSNTLKNIFNPGKTRSHPGTKNEAGTGLGLILCKDFTERNNGILTISSEENKGTTATFSIPIFKG